MRVEDFAREHAVRSAMVVFVGGAGATSRLVVGPEENRGDDIIPLIHSLGGIQEVVAVGTLFPDENGQPELHMHAATGREGARHGWLHQGGGRSVADRRSDSPGDLRNWRLSKKRPKTGIQITSVFRFGIPMTVSLQRRVNPRRVDLNFTSVHYLPQGYPKPMLFTQRF